MRRCRLASMVLALGGILVSAGCQDDPPTAVSTIRPSMDGPRLRVTGATPIGSYTVPTAATSAKPAYAVVERTSTGIQWTGPQLLEIEATGGITVTVNPEVLEDWNFTPSANDEAYVLGTWGPEGTPKGALSLSVFFQTSSGPTWRVLYPKVDGSRRVVLTHVGGELLVERTGLVGSISCSSNPNEPPRCPPKNPTSSYAYVALWALSGNHTVSANRVTADLQLTADSSVVAPGHVVTFAASTDPDSVAAVYTLPYGYIQTTAVPMQVQQWRWVPESDTTVVAARADMRVPGLNLNVTQLDQPSDTGGVVCTSNAKTCALTLTASGTMYVEALVNGEEQTQSIAVLVADSAESKECFEHDSLLNKSVQDSLRVMWQRMGVNKELKDRVELGGFIVGDSTGAHRFVPFDPIKITAGPCGIDLAQDYSFPANAEAIVHGHPYAYKERLDDDRCAKVEYPPGSGQMLPQNYMNRPSDDDISTLKSLVIRYENANFRSYILDSDGVMRLVFDPMHPDGARQDKRYPRCGY